MLIGTAVVADTATLDAAPWSHIYNIQETHGQAITAQPAAPWSNLGLGPSNTTNISVPVTDVSSSAPWSHLAPALPVVDIAAMEIVPNEK